MRGRNLGLTPGAFGLRLAQDWMNIAFGSPNTQKTLRRHHRLARPSGAPAGSICAALRESLKPATVLFEGDDPRAYIIASNLHAAHEQGSAGDGGGDDVPGTGEDETQGTEAYQSLALA
jgi:hypothetical protein